MKKHNFTDIKYISCLSHFRFDLNGVSLSTTISHMKELVDVCKKLKIYDDIKNDKKILNKLFDNDKHKNWFINNPYKLQEVKYTYNSINKCIVCNQELTTLYYKNNELHNCKYCGNEYIFK